MRGNTRIRAKLNATNLMRNQHAMKYLNQEESVNAVDSRVFIVVPPASGDSVLRAPGDLELDAAGCIVGVKIH